MPNLEAGSAITDVFSSTAMNSGFWTAQKAKDPGRQGRHGSTQLAHGDAKEQRPLLVDCYSAAFGAWQTWFSCRHDVTIGWEWERTFLLRARA